MGHPSVDRLINAHAVRATRWTLSHIGEGTVGNWADAPDGLEVLSIAESHAPGVFRLYAWDGRSNLGSAQFRFEDPDANITVYAAEIEDMPAMPDMPAGPAGKYTAPQVEAVAVRQLVASQRAHTELARWAVQTTHALALRAMTRSEQQEGEIQRLRLELERAKLELEFAEDEPVLTGSDSIMASLGEVLTHDEVAPEVGKFMLRMVKGAVPPVDGDAATVDPGDA